MLFKRVSMIVVAGMFSGCLIGCGGGGEDLCEEAFNKVKACLSSVDCSSFKSLGESAGCQMTKGMTYEEARSFGECDEDKAAEVASCSLDAKTCECKK